MSIGSSYKNDIVQRKITPLNQHLIATISKKFSGGSSGVKETGTSKYISATNSKQKEGVDSAKVKDHQNGSGISSTTTKDIKETNISAIDKDKQSLTVKDDDSSDDDIFADVGNYVHQELKPKISDEAASSSEAKDTSKQDVSTEDAPKKKSIFADLITETESVPQPIVQQQRFVQPTNQQHSKKKNVIDRDIFGGQQDDSLPYQKRRGPQTSAMEGVSMNAYDGGYGEEHDVDFGGDEEYQRKKDEDKRKEAERLAAGGEEDVDDDEEEG